MKRFAVLALLALPLFLSGCVLDTIMSDLVNSAPGAVVDATPREGAAPLLVAFDAGYSHDEDGAIVDYIWQFDDPSDTSTANGLVAEHTYAHPGTYMAKLTVIDNEGQVDSQYVAIVVSDPPPVAKASVSSKSPLPGVSVSFVASASEDYDGTITSYAWDFGDGGTATGPTASHAFVTGGYYVVTLTVFDDSGLSASTNIGINVQPGTSNCTPLPGGGSTCGGGGIAPLAVITGLPSCSGGTCGRPLTFDGTASRPGTGDMVSYSWDFGDGTVADGPIVTHVYTTPWTYVVTLTVVDESGAVGRAQGSCPIGGSTCY